MNKKWECFLCAKEKKFDRLPVGYLSNDKPLCKKCADIVLYTENHKQRFRLTYHSKLGEIFILANIPVELRNVN